MANKKSVVVKLNNVRISFCEVFELTAYKPGDKPACSAHFILGPEHPDLAKLKAAIKDVADSTWPGGDVLKALAAQDKLCLHDGNAKTGDDGKPLDGYGGNKYVSARSYVKPTVIDRDRSPLTAADGRPYSGCFVNAIIEVWPQASGEWGKRINAQLQGVQFLRDGDSFGGGSVASADAFEALGDEFGAGASDDFGDVPDDTDDLL